MSRVTYTVDALLKIRAWPQVRDQRVLNLVSHLGISGSIISVTVAARDDQLVITTPRGHAVTNRWLELIDQPRPKQRRT